METSKLPTMTAPGFKDLGRALCIVTGASRGFGRTVAREFSRMVKPQSVFILTARSGDDLRALQAELVASNADNTGLVIKCVVADLAVKEGVEQIIRTSKGAYSDDIDHILLVNNAASLGDVSRYVKSFVNMAEVDSYLSLNISSAVCLTAGVLQAFPPRAGLKRTVVNVSSLCALQPFPSWALYCTGKAARDMMFRVLAEEEPELRVLSYAPGPLDTTMQEQARTITADPVIKSSLSVMFSQGKLLTCESSCAKLVKTLLEDKYTSGAHLDFYDL